MNLFWQIFWQIWHGLTVLFVILAALGYASAGDWLVSLAMGVLALALIEIWIHRRKHLERWNRHSKFR